MKVIINVLVTLLIMASSIAISAEYRYDGKPQIYIVKSKIVYQDGDTIEYDLNNNGTIDRPKEIIRLIGYDSPECSQEWLNGSQEPYATQAKNSLMNTIAKARKVYIKRLNHSDKYMRTLAHLYVDDMPVAVIAVRERWGYETVSRYGIQGFPIEARMIMEEAKNAKYPYEDPWKWRRKFGKGTPK